MKKQLKFILVFLIVILFLTSHPLKSVEAQNITIEGILAHDFIGVSNPMEPDSYASIKYMVENKPSHRTGWSAFYGVCDNSLAFNPDGTRKKDANGNNISPWYEEGRYSTDDSGRDKRYNVSDYEEEIVSKYGRQVYEEALASGGYFTYQTGTKVTIYSKDTFTDTCTDGQKAFYYNNLNFRLTLTFGDTGGEVPPSTGESCPQPNTVPPRYEYEIDLVVNRLDARTVDINTNTNTDVYVSRRDFSASRNQAKNEFNNYITDTQQKKSTCESLIVKWQSEKQTLESQKASLESQKASAQAALSACKATVVINW